MLRCPGRRRFQDRDQISDTRFSTEQQIQDAESGAFGKRTKHLVHFVCAAFCRAGLNGTFVALAGIPNASRWHDVVSAEESRLDVSPPPGRSGRCVGFYATNRLPGATSSPTNRPSTS